MTKSSSSALCSCSVTTRWVSFVPRPADNAYRFLIIFGSVLTTRPTRSVVQATLLGKQRWCFLAPRSVSDEGSIRIPGVGGDGPNAVWRGHVAPADMSAGGSVGRGRVSRTTSSRMRSCTGLLQFLAGFHPAHDNLTG